MTAGDESNAEAEACGTPVIAYEAGGSPETLHDPRSKVVSPGDVETVSETLSRYFTSGLLPSEAPSYRTCPCQNGR